MRRRIESEKAALVVKALSMKTQGRPILLGQELEKDIQDYIVAMKTVYRKCGQYGDRHGSC